MFKKLFSILMLVAGFTFLAGSAQAQLNFFNGSSCTIQVDVNAEQNFNPCVGPTCASPTVTIPPGTSAVIPTGGCLTTTAGLGYRSVKFTMVGGITGFADKCTGPNPFPFRDCLGNPRQLQIFSPNNAAIF